MEGFRITEGKGFHITFDNGVTVSVQFGSSNYCDNYELPWSGPSAEQEIESSNAEVAVWDDNRSMRERRMAWITRLYYPDHDDDVIGHRSPDDVVKILQWARGLTKEFLAGL